MMFKNVLKTVRNGSKFCNGSQISPRNGIKVVWNGLKIVQNGPKIEVKQVQKLAWNWLNKNGFKFAQKILNDSNMAKNVQRMAQKMAKNNPNRSNVSKWAKIYCRKPSNFSKKKGLKLSPECLWRFSKFERRRVHF